MLEDGFTLEEAAQVAIFPFFDASGGVDFFADLHAFEHGSERVIIDSENFTAFVPYAARWPVELHLMPKRAISDLSQLRPSEADELADVYKRILSGLVKLYADRHPIFPPGTRPQ